MKTVWIVNHYAQTPGGVGGTRHYQLAKALRRQGWNACILAASTEYNTGFQRLAQGERVRLDVIDEIPFLWLRAPVYRGNGLSRIVNMFAFALHLLGRDPSQLLKRPDVIIGSSVHPFAVWSAEVLARRFKVPFVFEVRDLWPQTLIDFGLIKQRGLAARLLRALEAYLYRRASVIISLLPFAYRYIQNFGVSPRRIVWIPNGVDLDAWPISDFANPSGNSLELMYFGAFGQANALDILLMAMHELQARPNSPSVRVRLIGAGPLRANLVEQARTLGLDNVSFEDPIPKSEIPRLAAEADVLWANTLDSPLYKYGISLNKIYDYLAAARPVIFGCAAANNPVSAASAGIVVSPGNPSALADAIVEMARLPPADRHRMGLSGRSYVEREHDSWLLGQKLALVLDSCLEAARPL